MVVLFFDRKASQLFAFLDIVEGEGHWDDCGHCHLSKVKPVYHLQPTERVPPHLQSEKLGPGRTSFSPHLHLTERVPPHLQSEKLGPGRTSFSPHLHLTEHVPLHLQLEKLGPGRTGFLPSAHGTHTAAPAIKKPGFELRTLTGRGKGSIPLVCL